MSKDVGVDSSISERPELQRPRRLADWMNPTGERKVHSLIDKVYKRKNLERAWERVRANRGAGGVDGHQVSVSALRPRGVILMGETDSWKRQESDSLRRLNATLHGIEIMSYTHLLQRAKGLVAIFEQDLKDRA